MTAPLQFRLATREDVPAVVALLNETFRTPIDEPTWNWFSGANPLGPSRVYLGIEEGTGGVAGMLGFSPLRLRINGDRVEGSYAHHMVLKPDYRGGRWFVVLSRYSLEQENERGVRLVITASNRNAYPAHKMLMKWCDFGALYVLRKVRPAAREHRCELLRHFSGDFDSFYARVSEPLRFCMEKDAVRMNWRFCERPGAPYTAYSIRNGGTMAGYVVLKQWQDPDGYRKAHILDIHALDQRSFRDLIAAAESYAAGLDELNLWAIEGYVYREWLESLGFETVAETRPPFIARTFDGTRPAFPAQGCSLSYGDGDCQY